ncbi:MAG: Crp/Fnr family transcriptional regulator [Ruminococcus sp.]|jgi:CRP-like cAMP-binding protein
MNEGMKEKERDAIRKSALFAGIDDRDFMTMLNCLGSFVRTYEKGEVLSLQGEKVRCLGMVLDGTVHMVQEDLWGGKTILACMGKGEAFGETFVCGSSMASAVTFLAGTKLKVLFLPFYRVMRSCSSSCVFHHRLIENMVTLIADKNAQLMAKVEVISKKTLREKILTYLSLQAQIHGSNYFEIPMGRQEFAEFLCADRSALSRELSSMKADGVLDYDRNTFRLL